MIHRSVSAPPPYTSEIKLRLHTSFLNCGRQWYCFAYASSSVSVEHIGHTQTPIEAPISSSIAPRRRFQLCHTQVRLLYRCPTPISPPTHTGMASFLPPSYDDENDDILRWKSFRDLADLEENNVPLPITESDSPSRCTTDTTATTTSGGTPRSSWCDSDFTVGDSPVWCRGFSGDIEVTGKTNFHINVAGGEKLRQNTRHPKNQIVDEEEGEQFSPISVLDFAQEHEETFSSFHQVLANMETSTSSVSTWYATTLFFMYKLYETMTDMKKNTFKDTVVEKLTEEVIKDSQHLRCLIATLKTRNLMHDLNVIDLQVPVLSMRLMWELQKLYTSIWVFWSIIKFAGKSQRSISNHEPRDEKFEFPISTNSSKKREKSEKNGTPKHSRPRVCMIRKMEKSFTYLKLIPVEKHEDKKQSEPNPN
ncbi:hypothetical protein LXL04_033365 [Taraxacum kok-saghyz]